MAKSRRHPWQTEIDYATTICAKLGCTVAVSHHDYEIAIVKGDGVQLVIYPHKTSTTSNISARLRDNGSKDKSKARRVMLAMKSGEGLPEDIRWKVATFNTFYAKTLPGPPHILQHSATRRPDAADDLLFPHDAPIH
jgi:hypothetical protein